jgi:hypothetical protein
MKKIAVLISGIFLFATISFAQTPQTKDNAKPAAKTETPKKDSKSCCDHKDGKTCTHKDGGKSCCSHGMDSQKDTKTPEKK